jgi:SAM-dependent methyltransferase
MSTPPTVDTQADESRFTVRSCPLCGAADRSVIFDLEAEQFCSANWTYTEQYPALLGIARSSRFPVDRCASCGFMYARLLPSPGFLSSVYEHVIDSEKCREGSENRDSYARRLSYLSTMLQLVTQSDALKSLDYGCGVGVTLRVLGALGIEATGYEPSRFRGAAVTESGGMIIDNEQAITDSGPYDLIVCDNVLEHLPEPERAIELFGTVCQPGAIAYMSLPGYESGFVRKQLDALKDGRTIDMTLNPWEHLNYFTLRHLDELMSRHGFDPVPVPGHVEIGLRPEGQFAARIKNCLASIARLLRYAKRGEGIRSVESAFYRFGQPNADEIE